MIRRVNYLIVIDLYAEILMFMFFRLGIKLEIGGFFRLLSGMFGGFFGFRCLVSCRLCII